MFAIILNYAIRQANDGHEEEFGFEVAKRQRRRKPATYLTYLSYADDIELVSKKVEQDQAIPTNIQKEVANNSLNIYAKKIEIISINHNTPVNIELENCSTKIKTVTNFKYLGWMDEGIA